ncbi:hypothetical protein [Paenibacillus sp. KN14-4R]|uniref:hypothetical protein n=1 Tax=Paenibacillus sp. KN14-4R TaxID=3445773 RepID=UPI003FA0C220
MGLFMGAGATNESMCLRGWGAGATAKVCGYGVEELALRRKYVLTVAVELVFLGLG